VKHDAKRPLLQCADPLGKIRELMASREDAYSECADIIIDVDEMSVEMVVEEILTRLQHRGIDDMV
jgi:shikimate kinase